MFLYHGDFIKKHVQISERQRRKKEERKKMGRARVKDGVCGCSEATSMRKRESDGRRVERRGRG